MGEREEGQGRTDGGARLVAEWRNGLCVASGVKLLAQGPAPALGWPSRRVLCKHNVALLCALLRYCGRRRRRFRRGCAHSDNAPVNFARAIARSYYVEDK